MNSKLNEQSAPILFIPHGAGPLPLLGDNNHQEMVGFLKSVTLNFPKPSAIVTISAHWEEDEVTITSGKNPPLIYDYGGFPDEAYEIKYPVPGNPVLANKIYKLLKKNNIDAKLDDQRGFDHGLFVPLKIMFPSATIPCVQISLVRTLDPETHINIGKTLADLRKENILILGPGFSFHNLKAFFSRSTDEKDSKNEAFEEWLIDTCTNTKISDSDRETKLIKWSEAPFARYCHPREEHLLPLHVCYGISNSFAKLVFEGNVAGKQTSAFMW